MLKTLLCTTTATFVLCGAALADAPARTPQAFDLGLVIQSGKAPRSYRLLLVDSQCGTIKSKDADAKLEDELIICARPNGSEVAFEVEWNTREGGRELRARSATIAKRGGSFSLDNLGAKLTVSVN